MVLSETRAEARHYSFVGLSEGEPETQRGGAIPPPTVRSEEASKAGVAQPAILGVPHPVRMVAWATRPREKGALESFDAYIVWGRWD